MSALPWALAAAALFAGAAAPASPSSRPRSVILFMADGLSWGQLQLGRDAARVLGRPLALERLMKDGHVAYCGVTPLGALVPESGASASAYATGRKIANRSLSELPGGGAVETILELARRRGLATGLVTTARLTHATPASFLVHRRQRDDEHDIARHVLDSGVDVLLGGGRELFPPGVLERARAAGYAVLLDGGALRAGLSGGKTLGLFTERTFPFALDAASPGTEAAPTLAEMTQAALARLSRGAAGFVLVADARLIDEASHYNDAAAVLAEVFEADKAVRLALEFQAKHPDTEVLVVSNHETGGLGLAWRTNPPDLGGERQLRLIAGQRASFHKMLADIWERTGRGATQPTPALVLDVLKAGLPAEVAATDKDASSVIEALALGPKALPFSYSPAAQALARVVGPRYLTVWSTGSHTSSPQPCFGIGPGSERLHGLMENSDVFEALRPAADD